MTQKLFLGFAAGVMVAASVWSLLIPAMEQAGQQAAPGTPPGAGRGAAGLRRLCAGRGLSAF